MNIKEIKGDLFKVDKDYALVHCISYDCAMGKGIAATFDKKFPQMKNALIKYLYSNKIMYEPMVLLYEYEGRHIYNLITKEKYWQKPTYDTIEKSLQDLKELCIIQEVDKIAIPLIGCGLDRLKWDKVKDIIINTFNDTDIEITVCSL